MSLTSYDPNLSSPTQVQPPKLVPFTKIESVLQTILNSSTNTDKLFTCQRNAFILATRHSKESGKTSSLPIQTIGQTPQPSITAGCNAQVCIKTGYVQNDSVIVTKIAGGGGNDTGNTGAVLVFGQRTLRLNTILCDEGLLTEVRTAAACVYASKFALGQKLQNDIAKIGIVGGGVQAIWQLRLLSKVVRSTKKVVVKTRSKESANAFIQTMNSSSYTPDREWEFEHYDSLEEKFSKCQLIHTMTPSRDPVLTLDDVNVNSDDSDGFLHITSVGSDSLGKCELDTALIEKANVLLCDSIDQSIERGEFQHSSNEITDSLIEIGTLSEEEMRAKNAAFTIFDSSGVAFQDVEMANFVCSMLE